MARRLQLHEKLCEILGTRNVYFQPPESLKLQYDAIVYNIADRNDIRADEMQYRNYTGYDVLFISRDPDSIIPITILNSFLYCRHSRSYSADNLHHDMFRIYY